MPVHNTLSDMHNLLMEEMERLNEVDLEDLNIEVKRARAMSDTAKAVVDNAKTMMSAIEMQTVSQIGIPRELAGGQTE